MRVDDPSDSTGTLHPSMLELHPVSTLVCLLSKRCFWPRVTARGLRPGRRGPGAIGQKVAKMPDSTSISRAARSMLESEDANSHSGARPHLIRVSTRRDPTSTRASQPPGKPPRAYTLAEAGSSSASATTFEPDTVRALLAVLSART